DGGRHAPVHALQQQAVILLAVIVGGGEGRRAVCGRSRRGRLGRPQFLGSVGICRLGGGLFLLGLCRLGRLLLAGTAFLDQFIGSFCDLRLEIFHRGSDVEIGNAVLFEIVQGQVVVEGLFELLFDVVIDRFCRRAFARHAALPCNVARKPRPGPSIPRRKQTNSANRYRRGTQG